MSILANRSIAAVSPSQNADKLIATTRPLQTKRPSAYWRRVETNLSRVMPAVARFSAGCVGNVIAATVVAKMTVDAFARRSWVPDTGAPTTPVKKCSNINGLEAAKTGSSTGIPGPAALRSGRYDINDLTWDHITLRQRRAGRVMATIEPDSIWPSMWRVRMPDGHFTDMVNLTRAKDAAQSLALAVLNNSKNHKELRREAITSDCLK